MSIDTELARIKGAKADLQSWVEENGVVVPDGTLIDGLVELAKTVETGGGGNVACGTITPIDKIIEIEHFLGVVPAAFIWLVTFNNTMSGRDMAENGVFSNEKAYSTADLSIHKNYYGRMVGFVIGEYVYSLSYVSGVDWGYFTKGRIDTKPVAAILDETKFKSVNPYSTSNKPCLLPYDPSGNVTINWFAIGGA